MGAEAGSDGDTHLWKQGASKSTRLFVYACRGRGRNPVQSPHLPLLYLWPEDCPMPLASDSTPHWHFFVLPAQQHVMPNAVMPNMGLHDGIIVVISPQHCYLGLCPHSSLCCHHQAGCLPTHLSSTDRQWRTDRREDNTRALFEIWRSLPLPYPDTHTCSTCSILLHPHQIYCRLLAFLKSDHPLPHHPTTHPHLQLRGPTASMLS